MPDLQDNMDFSVRRPGEVAEAIEMLYQFASAGYSLFPLKVLSKAPLHFGWQGRDYSEWDWENWLRVGGNAGIRLGPTDCVLDCDPRNYAPGDDPLRRLSEAVGADLSDAPTTITGSGGRHLFFSKPAGVRLVGKLPDFAGLDVKAGGGLVVCAGSIHPGTGELYRIDPNAPPIAMCNHVPGALLDIIRRPEPGKRAEGGGGEITCEELTVLLDALDPRNYGRGHYDEWIRLAAACHDATNGNCLEAWLAWCARDPDYGTEATERNVATWASFTAGQQAGATYKALLAAVSAAGRRDLVARLGAEEDFVNDNAIIYELDEESIVEYEMTEEAPDG